MLKLIFDQKYICTLEFTNIKGYGGINAKITENGCCLSYGIYI